MDAPHEMSINDILAQMGYGHRRVDDHGAHEIYHIASGRVVGLFGAGKAIAAALADQQEHS